jgi:hypothetical protein
VQVFASHTAQLSGFGGGTNRFYQSEQSGSNYNQGLAISTATAATTFSATASVADAWAGLNIALYGPGTVLLRAAGGQPGGPGGSAYYNPLNNNDTSEGQGPGNKQFGGSPYIGGKPTTATHLPGNSPGGASAGGDSTVSTPANAAPGAVWLVGKQGTTQLGGLSGGGGTGGTQFSVTYEATGAGSEESTANQVSTSWQHPTIGGSSCGMVLIGAVDFSNGSVSVDASCGTTSFVFTLGSIEYYDASGNGLFLFALGLIGPPSGNPTVTLSASGSAVVNDLAGNTMSYLNVGGFGDFYETNGDNTSPAITGIPCSSGQLVVAGFASISKVLSAFTGTQRWQQAVTTSIPMVIGDTTSTSAVNLAATIAATDYWGCVGGVLTPIS